MSGELPHSVTSIPTAVQGSATPPERRAAILLHKAQVAHQVLLGRHLLGGQVVPMVASTPLPGKAPHLFLRQATEFTARHLATLAFMVAEQQLSPTEPLIEATLAALEEAQTVTGVPGMLARAYMRGGTLPGEAESGTGERWRPSGEHLWLDGANAKVYATTLFGYAVYHELAATEDQKRRIASLVAAVVERWLGDALTFLDADGSPVSDSSLAPGRIALPQRALSLLALQLLAIGHRLTGTPECLRVYRELADTHGYANRGLQLPPELQDGWSAEHDCLACEAYYHLVQWETDPQLLDAFRRNLEALRSKVRAHERPYLEIIYAALTGDMEGAGSVHEVLLRLPVVKEIYRPADWTGGGEAGPGVTPIENRPPTVFEWTANPRRTWFLIRRFAPLDYLIAYWMGRHHGLICAPPEHVSKATVGP